MSVKVFKFNKIWTIHVFKDDNGITYLKLVRDNGSGCFIRTHDSQVHFMDAGGRVIS
jgi:hypothetical protein